MEEKTRGRSTPFQSVQQEFCSHQLPAALTVFADPDSWFQNRSHNDPLTWVFLIDEPLRAEEGSRYRGFLKGTPLALQQVISPVPAGHSSREQITC